MSSIKEIAKRANVSIGTVDRVLHNRKWVARETEERVRRVIKELKYKQNIYASNLKRQKTFNFGALIPRKVQDNEFWKIHSRGMKRAQKELEGHKVKVTFFHYDRTSEKNFITTGERVLKEKLDGLVIAPLLTEQSEKFLKRIPQSLPYVFIDAKIPHSNYISFIGQEPFQSGLVSARLMKMLLPERGTIALIRIIPKYNLIEERIRGFYTYFKNYPEYSLQVYNLDTRNEEKECGELVKMIRSQNNKSKGLYLSGGHVGHFAKYAQKNRLNGKIHIIGYDLNKNNKEYLQNGAIDFLISQRSETQGYLGIYALYNHCVLKKKILKDRAMPIDVVMKENLEFY